MIKSILGRAQAAVLPRTHTGPRWRGVKLPPTVYRMGGAHFRDDEAFVSSAVTEVHVGDGPGFTFTHVDLANSRYNPGGSHERAIPGATGDDDCFYAYSVFSHLMGEDTAAYLGEVSRLLVPGGRAFVTAFVEEDVPDQEENPAGYGALRWSGPLHCVRYERGFFEDIVRAAGLEVESLDHGQEPDGQSLYVLRRPATS